MARKKAQKKHGKRNSPKQAQPKQSTAFEISSTTPIHHSPKSRLLATILVMMLVVSSTFVALKAGALSPVLDTPTQKAQPEIAKNTASNAFDELPEPPSYPTDMGYNASSGKFPPGALPPGVTLPGMNSYNAGMNTATIMDGRTTAHGYGVNDGIRQKFTGQIRDNETGLQYHGARYYNPNHGRFTGVDPNNAGAKMSDPQTWNGYSYAGNNPLKYNDPNGLWKQVACQGGASNCWQWEEGDTWETLARDAGFRKLGGMLGKYFDGTALAEGTTVDVSGFTEWFFANALGKTPDEYRTYQQGFMEPPGGGLKDVTKQGGNFFTRAWNRVFGGGSKSKAGQEAVEAALPRLNLPPGTTQMVNAAQLRAGNQRTLSNEGMRSIKELFDSGVNPSTGVGEKIVVNTQGVIIQGHHRAREAAQRGLQLEVQVVDFAMEVGPPITQIPIIVRPR